MKTQFFTLRDENGRTAGIIEASTSQQLESMVMDCAREHHCADDASLEKGFLLNDYIGEDKEIKVTLTTDYGDNDIEETKFTFRLESCLVYREIKDATPSSKFFLINGYWKDDKAPIEMALFSVDLCDVDAEEINDTTTTNGVQDQAIFYYGLNEEEIQRIIEEGEANEQVDFVITSYKPFYPPNTIKGTSSGITRQQFLDYFRSDRYNEEMSSDDCAEIFATSIKGSSDLSVEFFNEILSDYGADFEVQEKPKGLLHELIHSYSNGDTKHYFRCIVNCNSYADIDTALTDFEKMLIERFDIEYEPEKGESIRINEINISGAEFVMPMLNHN